MRGLCRGEEVDALLKLAVKLADFVERVRSRKGSDEWKVVEWPFSWANSSFDVFKRCQSPELSPSVENRNERQDSGSVGSRGSVCWR